MCVLTCTLHLMQRLHAQIQVHGLGYAKYLGVVVSTHRISAVLLQEHPDEGEHHQDYPCDQEVQPDKRAILGKLIRALR